MLNKTLLIESVNRELGALRELLQEMQERPGLQDEDMDRFGRRLKRVETDLKKIRRQSFDHGKYSGGVIGQMISRVI